MDYTNTIAKEWWSKHYDSANTYFGVSVNDTLVVNLSDVFPNLRADEFDIAMTSKAPSMTSGNIEVVVDKGSGVLVIRDGHHRFRDAILNGQISITVQVVGFANCITPEQ